MDSRFRGNDDVPIGAIPRLPFLSRRSASGMTENRRHAALESGTSFAGTTAMEELAAVVGVTRLAQMMSFPSKARRS